jgi:hypothetical protein
MTLYETAKQIAIVAHSGKFRRDKKTPYITHVDKVLENLRDSDPEGVRWGDSLYAIAALHDVLEDCEEWTPERLEKAGIPWDVVEGVVVLTKKKNESYWNYLARVRQSEVCRRIKIADIQANLSDGPTARQVLKYAGALTYLLGGTEEYIDRTEVYVLEIEHRHGNDITVYHSREAAEDSLLEYVKSYWELEIEDDVEKPEDDAELVDAYFEEMDNEFYNIECVAVV